MSYDIIGDIHGHADALKALLNSMGYRERSGAWKHPARSVIFVGDFIDRGPNQIETVDIVRRMVEAGNALAVMGNHELNAIAWYLPDPENPGQHLRLHHSAKHGDKNYQQHKAFLSEVVDTPRHKEIIDWFLTLPLWLDLPGLRVVHACWHPRFIDFLSPMLEDGYKLTPELMLKASLKQAEELSDIDASEPTIFMAVETLLKGIEMSLPLPHP
ncbi:MAG: metallophosphoesterase, partial [Methylophilus sp.]